MTLAANATESASEDVHQHKRRWEAALIAGPLAELSLTLGKFLGRLSFFGFAVQQDCSVIA